MTDPTTPDAQLDRLQQLQQRRAAATSPANRAAGTTSTHRIAPATGAKIATAGFFTATMFGMVGAMAISDHAMSSASNTTPAPATAPAAPATTAPPKVIVVVHHVDANGNPVAAPKAGTSKANAPAPVVTAAPPIALTAAPVVQRVPAAAAAAPVARTSGSRH